jgi:hypothetical protein
MLAHAFQGFDAPRYTQVPDQLFDELLPNLSGAELKVLLYIIRRTFGFKKDSDSISLHQICRGITTADGRVLDQGTGLHESTVLTALKGLVAQNIIVAAKRQSVEKGYEPTTYCLNLRSYNTPLPPVPENPGRGPRKIREGLPGKSGIQETVLQETVEQETDLSNIRLGHTPKNVAVDNYDEARRAIVDYIADFAREMADRASVKASTTRAVNLFRRSGLALDAFCERMCAARAIVQERTAAITTTTTEPGRPFPTKRKMGYFFAVLEDTVGLKGPAAGSTPAGEGRGDGREGLR